jgi:protein disulfide-isomerase A1
VSELSALGQLTPPVLVAFTTHGDGNVFLRGTAEAPLTHASMLAFGLTEKLPNVNTYSSGSAEDEIFEADVPIHLLYFHRGPLRSEDALAALRLAGRQLKGMAIVTTVDASAHAEVAAYFDVAPEGALSLPALIGFSLANATKFLHDGEFTPDNVVAFAHAARLGKLLPHIRSSPSVKSSGPLVELVGSNFFEVAKDPSKDVLVHFYSSTCGHCKKLFPVYTKVAEHFADEPEVVVAQIDAIANDIPSVEPAGYPTVLLYPKGAKRPIEYDGSRDSFDMIQFVKDSRAGRNHIGGLPAFRGPDGELVGTLDEDDGFRVEL